MLHLVALLPDWLFHPLGLCPRGPDYMVCRGYNFWSGIGSDLSEITLAIGLGVWLYKHNCHVQRCWRLSWHPDPLSGHPMCKKHHPHHPDHPLLQKDWVEEDNSDG